MIPHPNRSGRTVEEIRRAEESTDQGRNLTSIRERLVIRLSNDDLRMLLLEVQGDRNDVGERPHVPQRAPPNPQEDYKERPRGHERALSRDSGGRQGHGYRGNYRGRYDRQNQRGRPYHTQGAPSGGRAPVVVPVASNSATGGERSGRQEVLAARSGRQGGLPHQNAQPHQVAGAQQGTQGASPNDPAIIPPQPQGEVQTGLPHTVGVLTMENQGGIPSNPTPNVHIIPGVR